MNKIFGFNQEELSSLKATYTANEIYQQPELWKETLNIVENNKERQFKNNLNWSRNICLCWRYHIPLFS